MSGEEQGALGSGDGLDPADLGVPAGAGGDADFGDVGLGVSVESGVSVDSGGDADFGGDAACWLGQLCPKCGAVPEGEGVQDPTVSCWRCGAVRSRHTEGG